MRRFTRELPLSVRAEAGRIWERHRRLFWMLHSAWALASGTLVLVLARERYHLVPWVVLFLAVTWLSTLVFGRAVAREPAQGSSTAGGLGWEVASYITRVLYQETLFFLLPFYAYSTVLRSPNVLFLLLLGGLAVLSCLDLLFDRWLRTRPVFALAFFAVVAFAAINLLLPLIGRIGPSFATPAAALLAVGGAGVLALRTSAMARRGKLALATAAVAMVGVAIGFPQIVPPVPLRLERVTFASGIERRTLALRHPLAAQVSSAEVGRELAVLFEVFSPTAVPATVQLDWHRDDALVRVSRDLAITANANGFRVWDGWRPRPAAPVPPGHYRVVVQTSDHRVFGVGRITVIP